MIACVKLESATGSWTPAVGVRGKCITTQPAKKLINTCFTIIKIFFVYISWIKSKQSYFESFIISERSGSHDDAIVELI